ncbi:MAG: phosphatase PAP2 family protein [Acidimicrobiales bacterium]
MRAVAGLDRRLDAAASVLRGRPLIDRCLYSASALGELSALWQVLAAVRALRGDRRAAVRASAGLALESVLVNGVVKLAFRRTRPESQDPRPHRLRRPRSSSFPSGHASAAAFAVVVLGEDDPLLPLYVVLAVMVAWSRVHVRIHHPSDVLAGAALGAALGLAARRAVPLHPREESAVRSTG